FPKSSGAVFVPCEDHLAVAAEGHSLDRAPVGQRLPELLPGPGLPKASRLIVTSCQNCLAVGVERRNAAEAMKLKRLGKALARGRVPELRRLVQTPKRPESFSVRPERYGRDRPLM